MHWRDIPVVLEDLHPNWQLEVSAKIRFDRGPNVNITSMYGGGRLFGHRHNVFYFRKNLSDGVYWGYFVIDLMLRIPVIIRANDNKLTMVSIARIKNQDQFIEELRYCWHRNTLELDDILFLHEIN